jgi:hypothetical protein
LTVFASLGGFVKLGTNIKSRNNNVGRAVNVSLCGQFLTFSVYVDISFDVYWTDEPGLVFVFERLWHFTVLVLQFLLSLFVN